MILGIYGAGGLGREVYELARDIQDNKETRIWDKIVFIADYSDSHETLGVPMLTFDAFRESFPVESSEIVIAVGEPKVRAELRNRVELCGYSLAVLIHPAARISRWATLGRGCIITYGCNISMATVGKNTLFQAFSSLGHDSTVEEDCVISAGSRVSGCSSIGAGTYIGLQSAIREHVCIGQNVIVGMGSCVQHDIESNTIALGNPARAIRRNEKQKVFHG